MLVTLIVFVGFWSSYFGHFFSGVAAGNFPEAARRLFGPVRDMICFAPFLWAGWAYRHKPEIHKRLMLVATTLLLVAAIGRLAFLGRPVPATQFLLVWLSFAMWLAGTPP